MIANIPYRNIHLHGPLARFAPAPGEPYRLRVPSVAKAGELLAAQVKGFAAAIRDMRVRVVLGNPETGLHLDGPAMMMQLGATADIHLVPVAEGADSKNPIVAVIGVIIIAAAVYFSGGTAAGLASAAFEGTAAAGLGITYGGIALIGASLVLSGVSGMLAAQAKPDQRQMEAADARPSYLVNSLANRVEQGNVVPVILGRIRTGSVVVSAGVQIVALMGPTPPAPDPPDPNDLSGAITSAEGGWA